MGWSSPHVNLFNFFYSFVFIANIFLEHFYPDQQVSNMDMKHTMSLLKFVLIGYWYLCKAFDNMALAMNDLPYLLD